MKIRALTTALLALAVAAPAAPTRAASLLGTLADLIAGEPSEKALEKRARYEGHGVSFEYPAALEVTADSDDSFVAWTAEHGLFSVELNVAADSIDGATMLEYYADVLGAADSIETRVIDGENLVVCGQAVETTRVEIDLKGDVTTYEAINLPRSNDGDSRFLVFEDDSMDDASRAPTRTMRATRRMILESLRCE